METLADLVADGRKRDGTALAPPRRSTPYSYEEFCTGAWKTGNLLRHFGVHPGASVAVVVGPKEPTSGDEPGRLGAGADPLLAVLGGTLLGATVDVTPTPEVEARTLVCPAGWLDRYEVAPECSRLVYGGPPEDPDVGHFERERWSENPVAPPETVEPGADALTFEGRNFTHGDLVDAAVDVADEFGIEEGDAVGLDTPLESVGAVVAGVLALLAVGATIVPVPADGNPEVVESDLGLVVSTAGDATVPTVDPEAVSDRLDTRRV